MIFFAGVAIHAIAHIHHEKAHETVDKIEVIVTKSIYSVIRHLGYLGVMLMYVGFALWWGFSILTYIVALVFCILLVLTALEEEKELSKRFRDEHRNYMRKIRWRFIPGVF